MQLALTLASGETIPYQLERRIRRTVGLKITPDGLVVHAPKRIAQYQLETVLQQKADWILKKLKASQQKQLPPLQWQDGTQLLLLGNPITLAVRHDSRSRAVHHAPGTLTLAQPNLDIAAISRKILLWYKKQAIEDFARRLEIFSAKLGVALPKLLISSARTRWGSCNSKREVRLNWRLVQAPPHLINYVICHELAHLKEMNHSAKFWAVVASIYPDYKNAEKELKAWSPQLHLM